ncbi:MAG: LysE family transporter [Bacillota bacterium]
MELGVIFTTAFLVGLSGAMMPGPLLTVTIGESTRRGIVAGPLIVLGHGILEGVLVLALALGLATFLAASAVAKGIAVVGGLFLLYLGWGMFKDARAGKVELAFSTGSSSGGACACTNQKNNPAKQPRGMHPVLAGIFISLSNPYWSLWWATVGLSYITFSLKQGSLGLASFFTGHILSDLVWYSLVSGMIAGGRRFLKPVLYQGILAVCGLFLLGLGGYFIFWGVTA